MRTKPRMTILYLMSCFLFVLLVTNNACSKDYADFSIPEPEQAKDVNYHVDDDHKSKSITFKLTSQDKCNEVISFYDSQLSALALQPFAEDGVGDAIWRDEKNQKSNFSNNVPMRFIKSWSDTEQKIRFFLTIISHPESANKIVCSSEAAVFDFYSLSSLQSFFDSLTKDEKNRLMSIISKYTDASGTVDIQSAIKDHPGDQVLIKFANFQEANKN